MIGRRQSPAEQHAPEPVPAGKGRPTPKRKQAEARNKRPLVPTDRKAAKRESRQRRAEAYERQRSAMQTGDERYMPPRDKGPVRRYARDHVDARWCMAEMFLPIALLMMAVMIFFANTPQVAVSATLAMYGLLVLAIVDSLFMVWTLKRRLRARFGDDRIPPWTGMYAFTRSFMLRRMRMPKPQVRRGEYPA